MSDAETIAQAFNDSCLRLVDKWTAEINSQDAAGVDPEVQRLSDYDTAQHELVADLLFNVQLAMVLSE